MTSIVIPAYNEGPVIERCLEVLLRNSKQDEFEIVVVCNGCSDDTAARARRFSDRVQVLEIPTASKTAALNLGDQYVKSFPRFYLDADVELDAASVRDVAKLLGEGSPVLVASPQAVVAVEESSFLVRSFYKAWTALPYFREDLIGSGVYAFSRAGRERFGRFPDIIADDEFARLSAAPTERRACKSSTFTIHPPRSVWGLINIHTRARAGSYQLSRLFPELARNNNTNAGRSLKVLATSPSLWLHAPAYLGVMYLAKLRAERKLKKHQESEWNRDVTSRQGVQAVAR
jgi:hypothetical protein